jgi:glycosidase
MNRINTALETEYPTISIFGEAWAQTVPGSAYFTRNNMKVAFKHNLPGTTDFPMQSAMLTALNQDSGWAEGVNKLMMTLAQDVLYEDPRRNCIFLDNHDMDRFLTMIGGDLKKYKMGIGLLMTQRGIPQLYYGTEILMKNDNVQGDGKKRNDFPGGFQGSTANKFTAAGRTAEENEAFNYVKLLAQFRKQSKSLTIGTTLDFLPQDGVYVYARKSGKETVLCVINQTKETRQVKAERFSDATKGYKEGTDIATGSIIPLQGNWQVPPQSMWIISLK